MAVENNMDVEGMLEQARHDPELDPQVNAFFQNFSATTLEGLNNDLDRAIYTYLLQLKSKGKPN
jgi:cytidylate kinase